MDGNYKHPVDEKKVKFRPNTLNSNTDNTRWIIGIVFLSFILSALMQLISSKILNDVNNIISVFTVLFIIIAGIIFDIIGIAVTAADEKPFHAMASRKYYGAKQSIKLIRNANKVSSFCNDVVGDICAVISGTAIAVIILRISHTMDTGQTAVLGLIASGVVAALTIGGKALGKTIAIQNSNYIVYRVGVVLQLFNGRINLGSQNNKKSAKKKER